MVARPSHHPAVDAKAVGRRVQEARKHRGWTQEDLAERAELSQPAVSQLETNGRLLRADLFGQLARALGVSSEFLLYGQEWVEEVSLKPPDEVFLRDYLELSKPDKEHVRSQVRFLRERRASYGDE